jgi:hypothetical protein
MSGSKINGAGDGGLSCARQFSCLFDAISIPSSIPGRKHILVAPFKDGGLKGRECCSCSSFSSRTVMSPAAAKLHNTIYDPSILNIQISSLKLGNLTVKLNTCFTSRVGGISGPKIQQFFTTSTNFLLHMRTSRSLCAILFLVFYGDTASSKSL